MNSLPPEMVVSLCHQMDNQSLAKFVESSAQNYALCVEILQARRREIILRAKTALLQKSEQARQIGRVVNTNNFDLETGKGLRVILSPNARTAGSLVIIPGTNIAVRPERYNEIIELLNYQ